MKKKLVVHVDVDSPIPILRFYGYDAASYSVDELDRFYRLTFERMLGFFDEMGIQASLFVVGEDVELSPGCRSVLKQAFDEGHELENHSYSHPFGLAKKTAAEIDREVLRCNQLVEELTGVRPIGFRSPGYSMNNALMERLDTHGFAFDSSALWSLMLPLTGVTHKLFFRNSQLSSGYGEVTAKLPRMPYFPSQEDWTETADSSNRSILEIPLPRTPKLSLPFYHSFNLWIPESLALASASSVDDDVLVYLFHLVEFADPADLLPQGVLNHPNVKTPYSSKHKRTKKIFERLFERYEVASTRSLLPSLTLNVKS